MRARIKRVTVKGRHSKSKIREKREREQELRVEESKIGDRLKAKLECKGSEQEKKRIEDSKKKRARVRREIGITKEYQRE